MSKNRKAAIAGLLGYGIFGFSFLFSKTALDTAAPFVLLSYRFLTAFLTLNFLLIVGKKKLSLRGKPLGRLVLLGLAQPILYFIFETYGIEMTSAAFSGVMIGMTPVAGLVLGRLFLKERCTFFQGVCTLMSVGGVFLTTTGGIGAISLPATLLLLGAVLSSAMFTILSRSTSVSFSSFERTYVMFALGSFVFSAITLVQNRNDLSAVLLPAGNPIFWMSVLYLSVISSVCAFLLINYALSYLSAGKILIFSNFTTVISVLAGIFIMGDAFALTQLIGILMITVGVFGVTLQSPDEGEGDMR